MKQELTLRNEPIVITSHGDYHLIGNGQQSDSPIIVKCPSPNGIDMTLNNAHIISEQAINIESGYVRLRLIGTNEVKSTGIYKAGIRVNKDSILEITEESKDNKLIVKGAGNNNFIEGGAGIGSNYKETAGTIIINGGIINAIQGECSASIGGGSYGSFTKIEINNGHVIACTSHSMGDPACIGPGGYGSGGVIHINGGCIETTGAVKKIGRMNTEVKITGGNIDCINTESTASDGNNFLQMIELKTTPNTTITKTTGTGHYGLDNVVSDSEGIVKLWVNKNTKNAVKLNMDNWEDTPSEVSYISFNKKTFDLKAWLGNRIALLTFTTNYDIPTLKKLVIAMDDTFEFYWKCTHKNPGTYKEFKGLSTIALMREQTQPGLGIIGNTGIQIQENFFQVDVYDNLYNNKQFDQVLFYEMGRNFWFCMDKLDYHKSSTKSEISTGYAIFMRFQAMEYLNLPGAPFRKTPFEEFKNDIRNLINIYLSDKSLTWENTLAVNKRISLYSGSDLFASFCFYLKENYGGINWVSEVWRYAELLPNATTDQDSVNNFIVASSLAAKSNLCNLFISWRWPVPEKLENEIDEYLISIRL